MAMNMTLEQEFSFYKVIHMFAVLKAKMIRYYEVILADTVQLPEWQGGDTPEKLAQRDVEELYNRDINKFYEMYERAYQEFAKQIDF